MSDDEDEIKYNFYGEGEVENIVNIVLQNLNVEDLSVLHSQTRKNRNPPQKAIFRGEQLDFQSLASRSSIDLPFI